MATVLLVGAGATLAEALPRRPSKATTPPLDRTFFGLCSQMPTDDLWTVIIQMYDRYGIEPVESKSGMEEIFNYLYTDAIGPTTSDGAVNAYWALLKMYYQAIAHTTRDLRGTSQSGVGSVLRHIWALGEHELSVITFNQDLVVENALEEMNRTRTYSGMPWSIEHCYATEFDDVKGSQREPTFSTGSRDSIQVLKLHGSLNWVYRARSVSDVLKTLRNPEDEPVLLTHRFLPVQLQTRDSAGTVHNLPLVVPPVFEKSQHLGSQLASVWSAAEVALTSCTRLIVFGYSFPGADHAASALLRRAFWANKSLNELEVINPDASVVSRIGQITRAPSIRSFVDVSTFKSAT